MVPSNLGKSIGLGLSQCKVENECWGYVIRCSEESGLKGGAREETEKGCQSGGGRVMEERPRTEKDGVLVAGGDAGGGADEEARSEAGRNMNSIN